MAPYYWIATFAIKIYYSLLELLFQLMIAPEIWFTIGFKQAFVVWIRKWLHWKQWLKFKFQLCHFHSSCNKEHLRNKHHHFMKVFASMWILLIYYHSSFMHFLWVFMILFSLMMNNFDFVFSNVSNKMLRLKVNIYRLRCNSFMETLFSFEAFV